MYTRHLAVPDKRGRDYLFGRRLSDVAQISQRRGASSILRSKSPNETQLIFHTLWLAP